MTISTDHAGPDVLSEVLQTMELRARFFCRSELSAPWGISFDHAAYVYFHVIERGGCWLQLQGEKKSTALASGDLILLTRGSGHRLMYAPGARVVDLDRYIASGGVPPYATVRLGGGGNATSLACGCFYFEYPEAHPLLAVLPPIMHIREFGSTSADWLDTSLKYIALEARRSQPGMRALVSRLAEIVFIQALRSWMETVPDGAGGWLTASRDRRIGAALAQIHSAPEQPWSIASLARLAGLSRSVFAANFVKLVGEPPMKYLTRWRIRVAARMLETENLGVGIVAGRVGYASETAFSRTFREEMGLPPAGFKRRKKIRADA
jgi:AraC-like DNA-binding protein